MAAGLEAEGPLRDSVSFRWWISFLPGEWGPGVTSQLPVFMCSLWDAAPQPSTFPLRHLHPPRPSPSSARYLPGTPEGPHSLEDPALLQAVLAAFPHGCVVHSLDGPVDGLEDILLQTLEGGGAGDQTRGHGRALTPGPGWMEPGRQHLCSRSPECWTLDGDTESPRGIPTGSHAASPRSWRVSHSGVHPSEVLS